MSGDIDDTRESYLDENLAPVPGRFRPRPEPVSKAHGWLDEAWHWQMSDECQDPDLQMHVAVILEVLQHELHAWENAVSPDLLRKMFFAAVAHLTEADFDASLRGDGNV